MVSWLVSSSLGSNRHLHGGLWRVTGGISNEDSTRLRGVVQFESPEPLFRGELSEHLQDFVWWSRELRQELAILHLPADLHVRSAHVSQDGSNEFLKFRPTLIT